MQKLLAQLIIGIAGIWLASRFVPGVSFAGDWKTLIIAGVILGLINSFIKPILKSIALPIRIISLGLFSLVINMGIIWLIDIFFKELVISGILPLFWTSIIIWALSLIIPAFLPKRRQ